jgi:hypothetical protein
MKKMKLCLPTIAFVLVVTENVDQVMNLGAYINPKPNPI